MKTTLALTLMLAATAVSPATAQVQEGNWMVRGRVINVNPANTGGHASIGGKPHASTETVPEIDVTYFLNENIGVELIAATTNHTIKVNQRPSQVDIGKVRLLPPTLTAQYHVTRGNWKPYVGAGLTYAHFFDSEHAGFNSVKYDDAFGPAFQAGVDYKIADNWYLNADLKKVFLKTDVTVNDTVTAKTKLDPTIIGLGLGYRF